MQKVKLQDIAEFIKTGKTPPTSETKYFDGQVNWYTPGDFNNGKKLKTSKRTLNQIALDEKKAITFPKNTLLITCIGDIGKIGITQENCSSNQQITGIKPKENTDINYLYYWFIANKKVLENTANNAIVPILNNKTLQNIDFKFPGLSSQQKIANILDKADELRQYNKQLVEKYDVLTQSLFLDMFGDAKLNSRKWDLKPFEYFSIFDTKMTSDFEKYSNYPHVGIANIEKNTGKIIDYKLVCEENLSSGKYLFDSSHIIYSKIRPNLNKVALPSFKGLCSADSYPLKVKLENSNRIFFAYLLRSESFIEFILSHSTRTNIPKANKEQMKKYIWIAPPIELQNQFAERVQLIENQKQQAQEALGKSEALFQSLLQRAFKGELN